MNCKFLFDILFLCNFRVLFVLLSRSNSHFNRPSIMDLTAKLHHLELSSSFLTGTLILDARKAAIRPCAWPASNRTVSQTLRGNNTNLIRNTQVIGPRRASFSIAASSSAVAVEKSAEETTTKEDIESLFSDTSVDEFENRRVNKQSNTGASTISSGVRLENVTKNYKGVTVLKDINWEVKKGEKVGLVGVNGAGKTTQMRIIAGQEEPDSGNVIKAKSNMKIAFLSQEFEVSLSRTVREEFLSAFKEEMEIAGKLEKVQKALEGAVNDLELMGRLLDEFDLLQRKAQAVNLDVVDAKVSKLMPELGFAPEDSDRLVASFSSGWQMRMSLGKILLQVYHIWQYCFVCYCIFYGFLLFSFCRKGGLWTQTKENKTIQ